MQSKPKLKPNEKNTPFTLSMMIQIKTIADNLLRQLRVFLWYYPNYFKL